MKYVIAKDKVLKQSQNQTQSRFGNFKKRLRSLSRAIKPRLLRLSLAMTSRSFFSQRREGPTRNDKIGVFQSSLIPIWSTKVLSREGIILLSLYSFFAGPFLIRLRRISNSHELVFLSLCSLQISITHNLHFF